MAARRRSLEERTLKTIRELAALPANKQCFDCHQRGPTYINITIGSFVCTSCSGILRGLTPPHRAKSITMATFTPEEIDFLKSRGNEYCRYVWLGTYDSRTSNVDSDLKDEHKKKELMSQKYEKKRWYIDPEIAMKKMHQDQLQSKSSIQPTTAKSYTRVPEIQPLSQLLGKMPTSLVVENHQHNEKWPNPVSSASTVMTNRNSMQNQAAPRTSDLLSQFGSDAFSPPSSQGSIANGNFANFDSAFTDSDKPAHNSNPGMPASVSLDAYPSYVKTSKTGGLFSPPPAPVTATTSNKSLQSSILQNPQDRYAALADLDVYFHQPTSVSSPTWSVDTVTTNVAAITTRFSSPESTANNVFTMAPSNPFISSTNSYKSTMSKAATAPSINPFQNMSEPSPCLPYQQQQSNMNPAYMPLPVVGNSPSEDVIRAQFNITGSNVPFQPFSSGDVSNPPNGYCGGSFFTQNGELVTSPTSQYSNWGWPPTTSAQLSFTTSQLASAPPTALGVSEKCPNQFTQYSDYWMSNPANPFAVGSGTIGPPPKPSPTNPFL